MSRWITTSGSSEGTWPVRPRVFSLDPDVVIHRDTGQQRHLLPSQPLHPAVAAVHGQAGLLGREAGTTGAEELLDLGSVVHAFNTTDSRRNEGGTAVTWNDSDSRAHAQSPSLEPCERLTCTAPEMCASSTYRIQ